MYLGNQWTDMDGMKREFFPDWDGGYEGEFDGIEVLLAFYIYESYSGDAFVLYRKDGKLYEVNGSHCSCYGLEGQWRPDETNVEVLLHRLNEGNLGLDYDGSDLFASELRKILEKEES